MPVGGQLKLKGGESLLGAAGITKPSRKKKKPAREEGEAVVTDIVDQQGEAGPSSHTIPEASHAKASDPKALLGKTYEEEFEYETQRRQAGKVRTTAWGATIRTPMEIPHGYTQKVVGKTAEERLDLRATTKADKFCK